MTNLHSEPGWYTGDLAPVYGFHAHFVKLWVCLWLSFVTLSGEARSSHRGWCVGDQDNSFQLKREGSCLIRNSVLCSLFKRLWRHHVWREVKLWTSWRRRRDAMTTAKSQRFRDHLENSCDFLDCWVQDEVAHVSGKRYSWVTDEVSGELGNGQRSRATAELW